MRLFLFHKRANVGGGGVPIVPVSPHDSDEELQTRIRQLSGDEYEIYKWLREFYSERWIAETLLLELHEVKKKIRQVYFKLGVKNKRGFMRSYGRLPRPQKGPVDTEAIDSYIDARMKKAIQTDLDETDEGGNEDG